MQPPSQHTRMSVGHLVMVAVAWDYYAINLLYHANAAGMLLPTNNHPVLGLIERLNMLRRMSTFSDAK